MFDRYTETPKDPEFKAAHNEAASGVGNILADYTVRRYDESRCMGEEFNPLKERSMSDVLSHLPN